MNASFSWLLLLLVLGWPSSPEAQEAGAPPEVEFTLFHPTASPEALRGHLERQASALRAQLAGIERDPMLRDPKAGAEVTARYLEPARREFKSLETLLKRAAPQKDAVRLYREGLVHGHRVQELLALAEKRLDRARKDALDALRSQLTTVEKHPMFREPKVGEEVTARYLEPARAELKTIETLLQRAAPSSPRDAGRMYQEALVHGQRMREHVDAAMGLLERAKQEAIQGGEFFTDEDGMDMGSVPNFGPDVSATMGEALGAQLRLVARTGHTGPIRTFAFSPDGHWLVTAGEDKRVVLWDTETGLELRSQFLPAAAHELVVNTQGLFLAYDEQGGAIQPEQPSEFMPGPCLMARVHAFSQEPTRTLVTQALAEVDLGRGPACQETQAVWTANQGEQALTLAPSGQELLVASPEGQVRLQQSTGAVRWTLATKRAVKSAAFATEARRLAVLFEDGTVQLLDADSGTALASVSGGDKSQGVTLSPSGRYLAVSGAGGLRVWSVPARGGALQEERLAFPGVDPATVRLAAFVPMTGPTRLAVLQKDGVLHQLTLEPHRAVSTIRPMELTPRELRMTSNGQYLRVELSGGTALWWDLREGAVRDAPSGDDAELSGPQVLQWVQEPSPVEGRTAAVLRDRNGMAMGYGQLEARRDAPASIVLSPTGNRAAMLEKTGQLRVLELEPSAEGLFLKVGGAPGEPLAINDTRTAVFSPSGQQLYVGRTDGGVQLWDMSSKTRLAQLLAWPDGRWAVCDSEGRFDAANGGDVEGLYWVLGLEPIALSQLKSRYYEPFLLARLLGFQDEELREVRSFTAPKLYPRIQARVIEEGSHGPRLHLTLQARDGGIGRTLVSLNGKELLQLLPRARVQSLLQEGEEQVSCDWKEHEAVCDIHLAPFARFFQRHAIRNPAGQTADVPLNLLSIQAYNAEDYLVSRPVTLEYTPPDVPSSRGAQSVDVAPSARELVVPRLWAVVAGTSDYAGSSIDLRFADKDADDFARALELTARRLLCAREDGSLDERCDRVHIRRLSTTPGLQQQCLEAKSAARPFSEPGAAGPSCTLAASKDPCRPDKSNLLNALEELKQAAPEDIVVVYLAGHGTTFKGGDQEAYHYLTADAWSLDMSDPALRCRGTLSSNTLSETLRRIPARKQVLILDTCQSGSMVLKMTGSRGLSSSQVRAMEQMQDQTGLYVLAGAPSDAVSYESPELGQGLLTYSLLKGMVDKEALAQEALVDVGRMFEVAAKRASQVARGMNRQQRPVVAMPRGGGGFYIGQMKEQEQQAIQSHLVLEPRPRFVIPAFHDRTTWRSDPKLREAVSSELRERSYGKEPALAFVEVQDLPGAYELVGAIDPPSAGKTVSSVTARVFLDGKQVGCAFQVSGTKGTGARSPLAAALVDGALKQLRPTKGTSKQSTPICVQR